MPVIRHQETRGHCFCNLDERQLIARLIGVQGSSSIPSEQPTADSTLENAKIHDDKGRTLNVSGDAMESEGTSRRRDIRGLR
jgi:hypothetical protein